MNNAAADHLWSHVYDVVDVHVVMLTDEKVLKFQLPLPSAADRWVVGSSRSIPKMSRWASKVSPTYFPNRSGPCAHVSRGPLGYMPGHRYMISLVIIVILLYNENHTCAISRNLNEFLVVYRR